MLQLVDHRPARRSLGEWMVYDAKPVVVPHRCERCMQQMLTAAIVSSPASPCSMVGVSAQLLALAAADGALFLVLTIASYAEIAMLVISFRPEPSD
jgi:hypothetical protein